MQFTSEVIRNIVIVQFLHHSLSFTKVGLSSLEASLSCHCFRGKFIDSNRTLLEPAFTAVFAVI